MAWAKNPFEDVKALVASIGNLAANLHGLRLKQATDRAQLLSKALTHRPSVGKDK